MIAFVFGRNRHTPAMRGWARHSRSPVLAGGSGLLSLRTTVCFLWPDWWDGDKAYFLAFPDIADDFSVFKGDDAPGFMYHALIVRTEHKGDLFLPVQFFHDVEQVFC